MKFFATLSILLLAVAGAMAGSVICALETTDSDCTDAGCSWYNIDCTSNLDTFSTEIGFCQDLTVDGTDYTTGECSDFLDAFADDFLDTSATTDTSFTDDFTVSCEYMVTCGDETWTYTISAGTSTLVPAIALLVAVVAALL